MKKFLSIFILSIISIGLYAQNNFDTIHVSTDNLGTSVTKIYVIGGCKEMVVRSSENKCDTTIYDDVDEDMMVAYKRELRCRQIRLKPITQIYADEVFDYFEIKDSIMNVTKRLGNKKIHVTPRGYEVAFYNKTRKKNEIFEFTFFDGKLSSISRASTNTLPTNDVWLAFKLIPFKEDLNNLEEAVTKLRRTLNKMK